MKQFYLTLALVLIVSASFAQTKKDTAKYTYTVTIPAATYQSLLQLANEYKGSVMYNPNIPDAQKPNYYRQIDGFLTGIKVKVDSVKVITNKTK